MSDSISQPNVPPQAAEEPVSRRAFGALAMGSVGACYLAAIGYPVYRYLSSPVENAAAAAAVTEVTIKNAQKPPVGSALMFLFGSRPAMLIHHKDDSWVALTAVCTHLGCTVQYDAQGNRITCACHGGVYDPQNGHNVSGPPPKPLQQYYVKVTDEGIIVSRNKPA